VLKRETLQKLRAKWVLDDHRSFVSGLYLLISNRPLSRMARSLVLYCVLSHSVSFFSYSGSSRGLVGS
jgi:hypothetical protein